ncbi:MAG: hypothetical protein J1E80_04810 [Desulfovibrionaceae bacterium]|nr:hypothetical protein [Desulfovibrionaceae bacterium]
MAGLAASAVVPEQSPAYVLAVADVVPSLSPAGFLQYTAGDELILAAYDSYGAERSSQDWEEVVAASVDAAHARRVTVLGPRRPACAPPQAESAEADAWWALDLPSSPPFAPATGKVRNMLRRARREVSVAVEGWGPEARDLVDDYLRTRPLAEGTRAIYSRIGDYLAAVPGALLFAARDRQDGTLRAFAVGDYSSLAVAFYMFAFRRQDSPPGCADAVFHALLNEAVERGHSLLNLGLGINPGVAFFKRKWQARPWLPYVETSWHLPRRGRLARLAAFFTPGAS